MLSTIADENATRSSHFLSQPWQTERDVFHTKTINSLGWDLRPISSVYGTDALPAMHLLLRVTWQGQPQLHKYWRHRVWALICNRIKFAFVRVCIHYFVRSCVRASVCAWLVHPMPCIVPHCQQWFTVSLSCKANPPNQATESEACLYVVYMWSMMVACGAKNGFWCSKHSHSSLE